MDPTLTGQRVFVTGATGFIGRRLVAALVEAGCDVTVLTRSRSGRADLPEGAHPVVGDLRDTGALTRALTGKAILFNLAYDVRARAEDNLAAFSSLLSAAKAAGVGRIVHLSSIVVYDHWPEADCTEDGGMDRPASGYRQAKIAMERQLMAESVPVAILQPTIVYGPGSTLWTDGFATALLSGGVVLPAPEGLCNGVFVDDVVQACLRAATLAGLGQERFIVSGPEPFPWSALIEGYARILGRGEVVRVPHGEILARLGPPPDGTTPSVPSPAARVSAVLRRLIGHRRFESLVAMARRRLKRNARLEPDHHLLAEFSGKGVCHIDLARRRLGYRPRYDLAAGLAATADHLRALAP